MESKVSEWYRNRKCIFCNNCFDSVSSLEEHLFQIHNEFYQDSNGLIGGSSSRANSDDQSDVEFIKDSFLMNTAVEYYANVEDFGFKSPDDLFSYVYNKVMDILLLELELRKSFKVSILLEVLFSKVVPETNQKEFTSPPPVFRSFSHAILNSSMIPKLIQIVSNKFTSEMEYFNLERSGWVVEHIISLELKILQYTPLKASGYMPTPPLLRMKEASGCLLNIRNDEITSDGDHLKCFAFSILAADSIGGLIGKNRGVHWRNYKMYKFPETIRKVNFDGIKFPIDFSKFDDVMEKFHEQNPTISLVVIGYHETKEFSKNVYKEKLQISNASDWQLYIARQKRSIEKHKLYCTERKAAVFFPQQKHIKFENYRPTIKVPFTYYLDTEAYLSKPSPIKSSYRILQEHKCAAYSFCCISDKGKMVSSSTYVQTDENENLVKTMLNHLLNDVNERIDSLIEYQKIAYRTLDSSGDIGYFMEVDIVIPEALHSYLDTLPPVFENKTVSKDMLSELQLNFFDSLGCTEQLFKSKRLIADLTPKINYVAHSRLLKFFVELGLIITNVRNVLEFHQSAFLKSYVEQAASLRKASKTKFESDTFKKLSNAVYGRSLLQKDNQRTVKLITKPEKAVFYSNQVLFDQFVALNDNIIAVMMKKRSIVLNSPQIWGVSVLDISKEHFLRYFYNVLKPSFPRSLSVITTDTDGLCVNIAEEGFYEFLLRNKEHHDLSSFNKNDPLFSKYYDDSNKGVPGLMKVEYSSGVIHKACSVKPKMYALQYISRYEDENGFFHFSTETEETKRFKGLPKWVVSKHSDFEQFVESLFIPFQYYAVFKQIRNLNHKLYTVEIRKKSVSGICIKRFAISPVNTLAFGNIAIKNSQGYIS
ncbi:hypothetical protein Ocin01_14912 [Orchesella cincta]|uniref:C2H2-type domain-containing protein n=1 Tax=Orchesella cincta TaxID=48709 RepID=A0A1D2MFS9_ORCCI|nr:hypothetical protein Ocin01_14912 [Orchesella cincta]